MSLVEYSDSDSELEIDNAELPANSEKIRPKRKRSLTDEPPKNKKLAAGTDLPPLPREFHDLYASASRVSTKDDPSLHGGRKRGVPHIAGNWPTHIYLEWHPVTTELDALSNIISTVQSHCSLEEPPIQTLLYSDLGACIPLHISLSKPIHLLTDQREEFTELFTKSIKRSGVRPFDVASTSVDWAANEDKTRWFLVLRLAKPSNDQLNLLLHVSNQVTARFGKDALYDADSKAIADEVIPNFKSRSSRAARFRGNQISGQNAGSIPKKQNQKDYSSFFHISLAWKLGQPSPELLERTNLLDVKTLMREGPPRIKFDAVKIKIGNSIASIILPTKAEETENFLV
ncbi:MAG: poly(U)-specific 3'-to-5' RNA exonuclease [Trizodia sp. TS-e1964]|nr:MAG: poly(U)-specific 3'-to-5' RNA exonuclease [Trizodia sp. TS-e1964]